MKKKVLVFLIVYWILSISALTNWSQLSYRAFKTGSDSETEFITGTSEVENFTVDTSLKSGFEWDHLLQTSLGKNLDLTIENTLFYSEKSHELRNSFLNNYTKIKVSFSKNSHYLKMQYSNRWYEDENTKLLSIPGIESTSQQQTVHNTEFQYNTFWKGFHLKLNNRIRNLYYKNISESSENFSWDNDLFSFAEIEFDISDMFSIFSAGNYKNDLNEENWFNYSQIDFGLRFFNRFDLFNILNSEIKYYQTKSESIKQIHNFNATLRFTKRIGKSFAGFISYVNHSCFDSESKQIQRISNLLRIKAKYSYLTSHSRDSFLLVEIKINPENDGNLVSLGLNQYIFVNLYFFGEGKYAPDLYQEFSANLEYIFSTGKSIWIKNQFTDYKVHPSQNIISVGTTLNF